MLWTLTSIALVLSTGRWALRYMTAGRFYADDAAHLLSVLLLIALAATYTAGFPYSARIARITAGTESAPPLDDAFYTEYLQLRLVVTLLVFMVLWSVKATFLIFYRLLFEVSQTFVRIWWAAVVFVFASFWVCIGERITPRCERFLRCETSFEDSKTFNKAFDGNSTPLSLCPIAQKSRANSTLCCRQLSNAVRFSERLVQLQYVLLNQTIALSMTKIGKGDAPLLNRCAISGQRTSIGAL